MTKLRTVHIRAKRYARRVAASRLARGSVWLTIAMMLGLLLQAAYFVILARTLGAKNFGVFSAALAAVNLAAPFSAWGAGNLLVRDASMRPDLLASLRSRAFLTAAVVGSCLFVLLLSIGVWLSSTREFLVTLGILSVAELHFGRVVEVCGQCFQSQDWFRATGLIQTLGNLTRLGAVVLLVGLPVPPTPATWALLYLAGTVLAASISWIITVRRFPPAWEWRRLSGGRLRAGFFFSLGTASKTAYSDLDKVMLLQLVGGAANGVYTAAYRVITIATAPVRSLILGSNTRLFRAGAKAPSSAYSLAMRLVLPVMTYGAVAGGILFITAPLLTLVLGSGYADSVSALRWLAIMPLIEGVHYLFGDTLMGSGRQRARSLLQLGTVVLNVGLNVWLIPLYSWRGAAVASVVAETALALGAILMLRRMGGAASSGDAPEPLPSASA